MALFVIVYASYLPDVCGIDAQLLGLNSLSHESPHFKPAVSYNLGSSFRGIIPSPPKSTLFSNFLVEGSSFSQISAVL